MALPQDVFSFFERVSGKHGRLKMGTQGFPKHVPKIYIYISIYSQALFCKFNYCKNEGFLYVIQNLSMTPTAVFVFQGKGRLHKSDTIEHGLRQ